MLIELASDTLAIFFAKRHLPADQLLRGVVGGDLGARRLCPDRRSEIDRELVNRPARLPERLRLDDPPAADVHSEELAERDRRGRRIRNIVVHITPWGEGQQAERRGDGAAWGSASGSGTGSAGGLAGRN